MTKRCPRCDRVLPIEAFNDCRHRPSGKRVYCAECERIANVELKARLRRQAMDALGDRCAWCGIDDLLVLCIDHREGGGRKERKELGGNQFQLYRRVLARPERYQLLCHNCNHLKKTADPKEVGGDADTYRRTWGAEN